MAYVDRSFWWTILAILAIGCLLFTTETPKALVILAGIIVIVGIGGWFYSTSFEPLSPWLIRLASTILIASGIAFLIWYFYIGHTILRPIFDIERLFESVNERLSTPAPER